MTFEQLSNLVRDASMGVIFAFLWWTERMDRKASEKREREILRERSGDKQEE
jgi:hypothetical protein